VEVQGSIVGVDQMLDRETDVERDHRACDRFCALGVPWHRDTDQLLAASAVAAPESCRVLTKLLVAAGLSQAFQPQAKEPAIPATRLRGAGPTYAGVAASTAGHRSRHGIACSSAAPTASSRSSRRVWAVSITPRGVPSGAWPSGRLIDGWPV